MHRRDLLVGTGTVVVVGALAGCLGTAVEAALESGGENAGSDVATDGGVEPPFDAASDEPFERYEVGAPETEGGTPDHVVFVRNAGDDERSLSLAVDDGSDGLEETATLPANAYLEVDFYDPDRAEVVVETNGTRSRTAVGGSSGGCSLSVVTIGDGVRTETRSTSGSC